MLFHILRHINSDKRLCSVKQRLAEHLDQHRLLLDDALGLQAGTIDDVGNWLSEVNPNYDAFDINSPSSNNCGSCAWAVEQRLEGTGAPIATAENIGTVEEMNALTGMEQIQMTPDEIHHVERMKLP